MTLWLVLTWSVLRTLAVATLAVWLGHFLLSHARRCRPVVSRCWLAALLLPLLVPELLVGFSYRLTVQQISELPAEVELWATELLYLALLLVRSCAVTVLVLVLLPRSTVTQESLHSWTLLSATGRRAIRNQLQLQLSGPWRSTVIAWCLTALLSFQDFETAALIQVDQHPVVWTVWLFDAVAGNQILQESLRLLIAPLLFELLLLIPGLLLISQSRADGGRSRHRQVRTVDHNRRGFAGGAAGLLTVIGVLLIVGYPLLEALPELPGGMIVLAADPAGVLRQQLATVAFSATSAGIALTVAVILRRWNRPLATCCCLLPGLAGPLTLSLLLLWLFQRPGLVLLWDTWLPLLVGQSWLLLPRAWVLLLILEATVSVEAIHSARLLLPGTGTRRLAGERLLWRLWYLRWLAVGAVLCHWCTWDVTTASILRPVTVEPVVNRLYQEMHFSRTESLTALAALTVVFPFLPAAGGWLVSRLLLRTRAGRRA